MPRLFPLWLVLLSWLASGCLCAFSSDIDATDKLKLAPGLTITFPVREGIDTRRKPLGDYAFNVDVLEAGSGGYKYRWQMDGAANASGTRSVTAADEKAAHAVSLFYDQKRDGTILGSTNIVRVSDDIYQAIKSGSRVGFNLDGPEKGFSPEGTANRLSLPSSLRGIGEEQVYIWLNNKRVPVRAIKAQADNGWTYWVLDNPQFPVMVAGAGPFYWDEPRFTYQGASDDDAADKARREARRVAKDLEDKGVATTRAILFAFDSDKLTAPSKQIITAIGAFLAANPAMRLQIEGHTDNIGGFDYNLDLSRRRAESVRRFLIDNCSISAARLTSRGFGFTVPVADNKTEHGRAQNRRVVFKRL